MASAGLVTVTSTFENKTEETLQAISPNLIAAEPGVEAIAAALEAAAARVDDVAARVEGSAVRWPRDWGESFSPGGARPRGQPAPRLTPRAGTGDDCTIDDVVWP